MQHIQAELNSLRREYSLTVLDETGIDKNPIQQFEQWYKEAIKAELIDPNAMTLSTASKEGKPSSRIVLLREFGTQGFVFYSNYNSRKGREIKENPYVVLSFFWIELERQIHIEGKIKPQSAAESEAYFNTRPRESQLGAWASAQSEHIKDRAELDNKMLELSAKYKDKPVPCPNFWGGYCLEPTQIEFWQGRPNRLHDRILYTLKANELWQIDRLSP